MIGSDLAKNRQHSHDTVVAEFGDAALSARCTVLGIRRKRRALAKQTAAVFARVTATLRYGDDAFPSIQLDIFLSVRLGFGIIPEPPKKWATVETDFTPKPQELNVFASILSVQDHASGTGPSDAALQAELGIHQTSGKGEQKHSPNNSIRVDDSEGMVKNARKFGESRSAKEEVRIREEGKVAINGGKRTRSGGRMEIRGVGSENGTREEVHDFGGRRPGHTKRREEEILRQRRKVEARGKMEACDIWQVHSAYRSGLFSRHKLRVPHPAARQVTHAAVRRMYCSNLQSQSAHMCNNRSSGLPKRRRSFLPAESPALDAAGLDAWGIARFSRKRPLWRCTRLDAKDRRAARRYLLSPGCPRDIKHSAAPPRQSRPPHPLTRKTAKILRRLPSRMCRQGPRPSIVTETPLAISYAVEEINTGDTFTCTLSDDVATKFTYARSSKNVTAPGGSFTEVINSTTYVHHQDHHPHCSRSRISWCATSSLLGRCRLHGPRPRHLHLTPQLAPPPFAPPPLALRAFVPAAARCVVLALPRARAPALHRTSRCGPAAALCPRRREQRAAALPRATTGAGPLPLALAPPRALAAPARVAALLAAARVGIIGIGAARVRVRGRGRVEEELGRARRGASPGARGHGAPADGQDVRRGVRPGGGYVAAPPPSPPRGRRPSRCGHSCPGGAPREEGKSAKLKLRTGAAAFVPGPPSAHSRLLAPAADPNQNLEPKLDGDAADTFTEPSFAANTFHTSPLVLACPRGLARAAPPSFSLDVQWCISLADVPCHDVDNSIRASAGFY
ncbi:hypothetical protein FB451DRAFT_1189933 [Mycena latifolia]|nr:hypothetical protein FB451DRAFT_1189933 [Mycena latifolia]